MVDSMTLADEARDGKASPAIIPSFTPSIMGEEMLRNIFVARQPLVDRLVRNIREATTSEARRHALLVGPRGIGKTHLVSMVYYAVKTDADLTSKLCIAWLREEEWSIFSYADLLVQIFRALASEYPQDRQQLTETADKLRRMPIDEGASIGEAQLLEFLRDRLLLVIAENVNDIFEGMGEQGQQSLRAFLQNHSKAVLLTTAPSLTSDLSQHDAPFYGFFNTTHLQELTRAEARELLIKIAELDGPNTELVGYLKTDEADRRLKVIETLAGGHPRIWILFSTCMSQKLLDELVPLFVKMLDDLTPYYQERMRSLAPQERRIVAYLCEQRGAVPVREIAEACRLKPNAAAALLGKLEEKAFVRKAPEPLALSVGDRRVTFYEMREPLMRLCIEVKTSRAQPLGLIVEFLRLWFHEDEIEGQLKALPANATLTREYLGATLDRMNEEVLSLIESAIALDDNDFRLRLYHGMILRRLGRFAEAHDSKLRVYVLQPNDIVLFSKLIDLIEGRQFEAALKELEVVLPLLPSATEVAIYSMGRFLTGLLASSNLRSRWLELATSTVRISSLYKGAMEVLATAITRTIIDIATESIADATAEEWLSIWESAGGNYTQLETAIRLLRASVEWKRTRDRGAILRLAAEERVVLEALLPKY